MQVFQAGGSGMSTQPARDFRRARQHSKIGDPVRQEICAAEARTDALFLQHRSLQILHFRA